MNPLLHIRRHVFRITQAEMAAIAGVQQSQVSRWESGTREPSLQELNAIRAAAEARGIAWDDSWFFGVPAAEAGR